MCLLFGFELLVYRLLEVLVCGCFGWVCSGFVLVDLLRSLRVWVGYL